MEENKVVDNQNNELEEPKYTLTDISEAMRNVSPKAFETLFTLHIETLYGTVNFQKGYDIVVKVCDNYINTYQNVKNAINELREELEKQSVHTMEDSINRMVDVYKKMNREERFNLNQKLSNASSLENSLDNFKHTWNNFTDNLLNMLGVK